MDRNLKLFLSVVLLSFPFWMFCNFFQGKVSDFFYQREFAKRPLITPALTANISLPKKQCDLENITPESYLSFKKGKVLFEKEMEEQVPIASLTKLMTAVIASEFYSGTERVLISEKAVNQTSHNGFLRQGEVLSLRDLLKVMLIESSNDAAYSLADLMTEQAFVDLMNLKAEELNLDNTFFYNATGIDPEDLKRPKNQINLSTAHDLAKLTQYILENHPEIIEILSEKKTDLYLDNGIYHHTLENTNELLGEDKRIIAGKTGFTERAGQCLLIIIKDKGFIINTVLGSEDRFQDMTELINCSLPFNSL